MPWIETCAMEQRSSFIEAWLSKRFAFSTLCRRFGISRKTGYKWVKRFIEEGKGGLHERSRAAHHHPNQTPPQLVEQILNTKLRFPDWGPVTVVGYLRREYPKRAWPASSTVGELLKRHGLVQSRGGSRRRTPPHSQPLRHARAVHDVWSADFKGDFLLGDRRRCYPLTITDNHSRYLIECKGFYSTALGPVKKRFEHAFRRYGLPRAVRTDNGYPFASTGLGGLSALSVWLLKLGVLPERIAPGHPEQNPRHERMHRTLKQATAAPPCANLSAQQRAFNRFCHEYNHLRPHQGLGRGRRPGELFAPSPRSWPDTVAQPTYAEHFLVRRVRRNGEVKCAGHLVYLSQTLAREYVGFEPLGEELYQCYFAMLPLGVFDARLGSIIRPEGTPKSGQ